MPAVRRMLTAKHTRTLRAARDLLLVEEEFDCCKMATKHSTAERREAGGVLRRNGPAARDAAHATSTSISWLGATHTTYYY